MIPNSEKKAVQILYALLCWQCITISFNVAAIAAAIPAISRDLALNDLSVAKIIPFYMVPYGIGALLYAFFAKRIPFRFILTWSMLLYAASSLLCAKAQSLNQLLLGRVIMGVAGAGAIPLGLILIGRLFDKNVRGRRVGIFFSCSFFSSIVGIILSGTVDWRWLFYVPTVLAVIAAVGVALMQTPHFSPMREYPLNYRIIYQHKEIRNVFAFIFVISMLFHAVHKWLGVYLAREYMMPQFVISVFFIFMSFGGAFGQILGGILTDKKGRYHACLAGILLLSLTVMLLAGHYSRIILGIILFSFTAGWTIGHNGASTILTDFPDEHRPEIASLNSSLRFLSGGIGFFISRFFVAKSFGLTFLGCGILLLLLSFSVKYIIPASSSHT